MSTQPSRSYGDGSPIKPGHRAKVTLEGVIDGVGDLKVLDHDQWIWESTLRNSAYVSIERLPDPEPEWQAEDHVLAADGRVYRFRGGTMWFAVGELFGRSASLVPRPLIPLVRGGKPWAEAVSDGE